MTHTPPLQASIFPQAVSFDRIGLDGMNHCLVRWGHKMGPLNRPMGLQAAHGLFHDGELVGVTGTADLVAPSVAGFGRREAVELARVCASRPDICRLLVRMWREFVFPGLGRPWALSYQDAALHSGNLYRFDGWTRIAYSHSGTDRRSGRKGRDKWIWGWNADPDAREAARGLRGQS